MIVVDTNVIAALLLRGPLTEAAERLFETDADWQAPVLWRSEFRNVLATQVRVGAVTLAQAAAVMQHAEALMLRGEREVDSSHVLAWAERSGCTAYDCEFVEVAKRLGVPLYTLDKQVLKAFPETATRLA